MNMNIVKSMNNTMSKVNNEYCELLRYNVLLLHLYRIKVRVMQTTGSSSPPCMTSALLIYRVLRLARSPKETIYFLGHAGMYAKQKSLTNPYGCDTMVRKD